MKPKDIQRGIASRHCREGGDAPNLGRVARLHDAGDLQSRRRGELTPARRKALIIWSSILSLATLAAIALAVSFWLQPYLTQPPAAVAVMPINYRSGVRIASKFASPSREQSLDFVKLALANRDPEKIDTFFRPGTATRAEILDFLVRSEQRDGPVERCDWLSSMDVPGLLMDGVLVVYPGKERPVERIAFLTPDSAGRWKLDFEAFARSVKPTWDDLLEKGAEQALVRVFIGRDVYYNGPFSDEKQWVCYGIASPDREDLLRGYCKIGSPQAVAVERMFSEGRRLSRATLELRRVKDGGTRQFEITRLVAEDWVVAGDAGGKG